MDVSHIARSHAVRLMRFHMHDWVVIVGLMIMIGILNTINPFYRFVGKTMLDDLMFPLKENTVPFWAVPILAVIVPIIIFFSYYLYRRDINDLHHAILGLLFSVLISAVITNAVKDAVGRPRPDFFWRCFPDGIPKFDNITGRVECYGDPKVIREGHKSFPSGHTSWLGFLSLYLAAKIEIFDRKGHAAKLCIVFLPIVVAILVGISRVDDYWHHWQDVFVGALLGLTMATLCYRQFFPAPYDSNGVGPYTSFRMLTDAHTTHTQAADGGDTEFGPYFRLDGTLVADNRNMQEGGDVNWQAESGAELDLENERGMEGRGVLRTGTTSLDTKNVPSDEPTDRRLYMERASGLDREWTTDGTGNRGTMGEFTTGSVSADAGSHMERGTSM